MNRILGVMMPVYNEAATLETILLHVLESPLVAQVVIVDERLHGRYSGHHRPPCR
jgi:hypothetical protein